MGKIADAATVIHVFGTFHVLPEGLRWRTAKFEKVMAEAKEVEFEVRGEQPVGGRMLRTWSGRIRRC